MRDPLRAASVLLMAVLTAPAASVATEEPMDAESFAALCAAEPGEAGVAACRRAVELGYFELGRPFSASPEAYGRLGEALGQLGRWDEACRAYREMIRLDREASVGHYKLGVTLLEKLDRAEEFSLS